MTFLKRLHWGLFVFLHAMHGVQGVPSVSQKEVDDLYMRLSSIVPDVNKGCTIACVAYSKALDAFKMTQNTTESLKNLDKILDDAKRDLTALSDTHKKEMFLVLKSMEQEVAFFTKKLQQGYEGTIDERIAIARAKIDEKARQKIYEQTATSVERERWEHIKEILDNPGPLIKGATVIGIFALIASLYRVALQEWLKPAVILQTSCKTIFGAHDIAVPLQDLVFSAETHLFLRSLQVRLQPGGDQAWALPNIIFYGPPGTGKTAAAKALAYASGMDYAITSGTEFMKLSSVDEVIRSLRSLFSWAGKSKNGVIIFVDEAESLFASRVDDGLNKFSYDVTNSFLSLIAQQSQKKVMFIFATNHPQILDQAFLNRVGYAIPFFLPNKKEKEQLFLYYVRKALEQAQVKDYDTCEIPQKMVNAVLSIPGSVSQRDIVFIAHECAYALSRKEILESTDIQRIFDLVSHKIMQAHKWEGRSRDLVW